MSHELDINAGVTSFVSAREDAWHALGTTLPDAFDAESALHYGHLKDWNLRKAPLLAQDTSTTSIQVPDTFAVLRDNPVIKDQVDVLGTVGKKYAILQNEELVGLLDTIIDESGANFETAGAVKGGKQVFVTMKLPGHISIGGVDPIDQYIAATTAHDGSASTSIMVTPVRIVCQNTLNMAFNQASHVFRVKHLAGSQSRMIGQARESLDFSFNFLDGFKEEAYQMLNTPMTDGQFNDIIRAEFGAKEGAPAPTVTRSENKLAEMEYLFSQAPTQEAVRGTVWAGLNAITEWADHFAPVRPGDNGDDIFTRSQKALFDPYVKNSALKRMGALV